MVRMLAEDINNSMLAWFLSFHYNMKLHSDCRKFKKKRKTFLYGVTDFEHKILNSMNNITDFYLHLDLVHTHLKTIGIHFYL